MLSFIKRERLIKFSKIKIQLKALCSVQVEANNLNSKQFAHPSHLLALLLATQVREGDTWLLPSPCPALWRGCLLWETTLSPAPHCKGQRWERGLGTAASALAPAGTCWPFCAVGQGWCGGCGRPTAPPRTGTGDVVPKRKESIVAVSQIGIFWLKEVQVLVYGSKHAACLMNALFIGCASCWKYQSG